MLARFCAILLFLWTSVIAGIVALVLQLCEPNKLKLKLKYANTVPWKYTTTPMKEKTTTTTVEMNRILYTL